VFAAGNHSGDIHPQLTMTLQMAARTLVCVNIETDTLRD
jgi:hypothetical protein